MSITELGLALATKRVLHAAGITSIEQLQRPANELLEIEPVTGAVLYSVVRCLHAHKLGLHTSRRPIEKDIEMLRLRVVEGLALRDIAVICGLSPGRVRQRLNLRFGLSGESPAVLERRRLRVLSRLNGTGRSMGSARAGGQLPVRAEPIACQRGSASDLRGCCAVWSPGACVQGAPGSLSPASTWRREAAPRPVSVIDATMRSPGEKQAQNSLRHLSAARSKI